MRRHIGQILLITVATVLALGALVFAIYRQLASTKVSVTLDTPLTANYHSRQDITYCSPGGNDQKLDIHIPDGNRTYPLLVYVHGGGWYAGSKESDIATDYISEVARLGYVVASINYRLVPDYTFPAQIEDTKCAIRYLRAHAAEYKIASRHVGIIGESAGGYLAALTGTTGDARSFKTTEYAKQSDKVQAVVDLFGPTTLVDATAPTASTRLAHNFLGNADAASASATTYVSKDDPPFLIVHGDADTVVPLDQSQTLLARLQAAGAPAQLIVIHNAGHGLSVTNGQPLTPGLGSARGSITGFLAAHLKNYQ